MKATTKFFNCRHPFYIETDAGPICARCGTPEASTESRPVHATLPDGSVEGTMWVSEHDERMARKAANEARRDEAMAENARFAAERPDLTVYVLYGLETVQGVYGSLEGAQAAVSPGEWYSTEDGVWHRGPGPDSWAWIESHRMQP